MHAKLKVCFLSSPWPMQCSHFLSFTLNSALVVGSLYLVMFVLHCMHCVSPIVETSRLCLCVRGYNMLSLVMSEKNEGGTDTETLRQICYIHSFFSERQTDTPDMGNVTSSSKGSTSTVCNPLVSPGKKHIQHQNDLNTRQCQYQTLPPQYINGSGENTDVKYNVSDGKSLSEKHKLKNSGVERTSSPAPLGTEKIRLTMDVNNSRPTSRTGTPVLTRKAAIRDGSHTSSPSSTDQNRSNSSSSLKDSQAKDIMISYSHLDKEIMLRLKGMKSIYHNVFTYGAQILCHNSSLIKINAICI